MKPTLLLTLLPLVFSAPQLLAKSDLEILRARCAEQERQIRELEEENAKLRSLHDQPVKSTRLTSSAGAGSAVAAGQASPQAGTAGTYVVRSGDSWERIARKFDTQPAALASLNRLKVTSMIHAGQKLKVPGASKPTPSPATAPVATHPEPVTDKPAAGRTHVVKQGETYSSIARKYGVSSASLIAANPTIKPLAMRPGLVVQLGKATSAAPATVAATPKRSTPATEASAHKPATAAASPSLTESARTTLPVSAQTPAKSTAVSPPAAPAHAATAAASSAPKKEKTAIKYVTIDGSTTFGEFAAKHGTDINHLNDLNALDLVDTTVLAKGSELYVPAQP